MSVHKCEHVGCSKEQALWQAFQESVCGTILMFILRVKKREVFQHRLKNVRQLLTPPGSSLPLDNCSLFNVLCDIAEDWAEDKRPSPGASTADPENEEARFVGGTKSFMRNSGEFVQCWPSACWFFVSGVYTHDDSPSDRSLFVIEKHSFADLHVSGLSSQCTCGARASWTLAGCVQVEWSPSNCEKCATMVHVEGPCALRDFLMFTV